MSPLKDAMDAAHGHSHGANGEELKPGRCKALAHEEKAEIKAGVSWWLPVLTGIAGKCGGAFCGEETTCLTG